MICPSCQREVADSARFCRHCGARLEAPEAEAGAQPRAELGAQPTGRLVSEFTSGPVLESGENAEPSTDGSRPQSVVVAKKRWMIPAVSISASVIALAAIGGGYWWWSSRPTTPAAVSNVTKASGVAALPSVSALVSKTIPDLAYVDVMSSNGEDVGSGFLIDKQGDVLTNAHVVAGAQSIKVKLTKGPSVAGTVIGVDVSHDIAEIRVNSWAGKQPLPIATKAAQLGDSVVALGSPFGLTDTVTTGIISGLNRNFTIGAANYQNMYQISAPIAPGNSGGPLVSAQTGEVLGVDTAGMTQSSGNIGFAIPITQVIGMARQWAQQPMSASEVQSALADAAAMDSGTGSGVGNSTSGGFGNSVGGGIGNSSGGGIGSVGPSSDMQTACLNLIQTYYNYLNSQDFLDAYALLSPDFQATMPYTSYVTGFSNTLSSTPENATYTQVDASTGKVTFTLVAQEIAANGSQQTSVYHNVYTCQLLNGNLLIEHATQTLVNG